jgi:hypothetical protein
MFHPANAFASKQDCCYDSCSDPVAWPHATWASLIHREELGL